MTKYPQFDCYRALGIAPNASADEVKSAYRRMSKLFQPDSAAEGLMQAANDICVQLNEAYEWLSDASGRREFDNYRGRTSLGPTRLETFWGKHGFRLLTTNKREQKDPTLEQMLERAKAGGQLIAPAQTNQPGQRRAGMRPSASAVAAVYAAHARPASGNVPLEKKWWA